MHNNLIYNKIDIQPTNNNMRKVCVNSICQLGQIQFLKHSLKIGIFQFILKQ
jgi:hypothetical protein